VSSGSKNGAGCSTRAQFKKSSRSRLSPSPRRLAAFSRCPGSTIGIRLRGSQSKHMLGCASNHLCGLSCMTPRAALAFVRRHGVVLEGARGPVPNLAEAVVGARIRGSWWGHRKGKEIFWLTRAVRDSPEVLVCRLVGGKVTYVHRRLWPALVRLARAFGPADLGALQEVHTPRGRHELQVVPFPRWVPAAVKRQARRLSEPDAHAALGTWF
jgi:hypothetical protein